MTVDNKKSYNTQHASSGLGPDGLPNYDAAAASSSVHQPLLGLSPQNGSDGGPASYDSKFAQNPKYQDKWATALFVAQFVVLEALAIVGYRTPLEEGVDVLEETMPIDGEEFPLSSFLWIVAITTLSGFGMTVAYFAAVEKWPRQLIKVSFFFNTVIALFLGIIYLFSGSLMGGLFCLFYAGIHIFMYYAYRSRIEFAKVMLEHVTTVIKRYPGTIASGVIGLQVQTVFAIVWAVSAFGAYRLVIDSESPVAKYTIIGFLLFSMYWTGEIIRNTVHVTVAGVFATYFFTGVSNSDGSVTVPVRNPTLKAAKRALTTSFGSIAFGSLIIALFQTVRSLLSMARQHARDDQNAMLVLILSCADCLLAVLEGFAVFINKYAYTQVAIYGKAYWPAAKDTWTLIKARGIDLIINDDLTSTVMFMGSLVVGLINTLFAYIYVNLMTGLGGNTAFVVIVCMTAFMTSSVQFMVMSETIISGVATTFVCFAEDPAALERTKPDLYQKILNSYPNTQIYMMP
ncbi:plasma-membrane choline transporter-domain-containing protein [Phlyctochytrium arcticum]|nr:plasma-membrane choline transporter-domain-containing protein [Phlyctochytrium arcticum]